MDKSKVKIDKAAPKQIDAAALPERPQRPARSRNKKGMDSPSYTSITVTTPTGAVNTVANGEDYKVDDYVRLTDLRQGYIRYVGQTAFSKHILYGVELDDKYEGKHSGMWKGVKYFDCASPNKGIFVPLNKIASKVGKFGGSNPSLLGTGSGRSARTKHGRKLSTMIYRHTNFNKSRVSFVVPDVGQLLLSPTAASDGSGDEDDDNMSVRSEDSVNMLQLASPPMDKFTSLMNSYSSEMKTMEDINEEEEEVFVDVDDEKSAQLSPQQKDAVSVFLTPTGKTDIMGALKRKIKRIRKKEQQTKGKIGVRIPFGKLNSKCMAVILRYLTMAELSEYAFVSKSARDSIRLVATYDFRYMLYDGLCVQEIRKILCILKFHKPKELILPMAYFIYDPVILRLFLQFFNVEINAKQVQQRQQVFKYIHKLVIDDRDIRPNSWLMRPGNYPWNELCNKENEADTVFPYELVECFQSLGNNLWELDIRYTINIELSYFMKSCESVLYLSVAAENREDMERFVNVTHLTIQNKIKTWEEIERSEFMEWRSAFTHLTHLTIINQRFEASMLDLFASITWIPALKTYLMSNCHFNEPTQSETIAPMKKKSNLNNRVHTFILKRQLLSKNLFTIVSEYFHRINKFELIDCRLKKTNFDFDFFKPMTHLTNMTITNMKPKKRLSGISYAEWLQSVFDKITKHVSVCPVIIECNLIKSPVLITSHTACRYCKQLVDKKQMGDHLQIMCPERSVECCLCQGKVKRKSLSYHWQNNCKEYYINCFLCPKLFTVKTRDAIHDHVLRHSMSLDEESGKYEMVFIDNRQATNLANEYPVYSISICKKCETRSIGPVVPAKYRKKLIPDECDSCADRFPDASDKYANEDARTRGKRISVMKKSKGKFVLPHPYPKTVKLKHKETNVKLTDEQK